LQEGASPESANSPKTQKIRSRFECVQNKTPLTLALATTDKYFPDVRKSKHPLYRSESTPFYMFLFSFLLDDFVAHDSDARRCML
jgi:hypothetical protein